MAYIIMFLVKVANVAVVMVADNGYCDFCIHVCVCLYVS